MIGLLFIYFKIFKNKLKNKIKLYKINISNIKYFFIFINYTKLRYGKKNKNIKIVKTQR